MIYLRLVRGGPRGDVRHFLDDENRRWRRFTIYGVSCCSFCGRNTNQGYALTYNSQTGESKQLIACDEHIHIGGAQ